MSLCNLSYTCCLAGYLWGRALRVLRVPLIIKIRSIAFKIYKLCFSFLKEGMWTVRLPFSSYVLLGMILDVKLKIKFRLSRVGNYDCKQFTKKKGVTSRDRSALFLIVSFSCSLLGCLNLNDTDQVVAWHKKLRSVILWRPVFWIFFCFVLFLGKLLFQVDTYLMSKKTK